jgi:hypothetical protein
MLGPPGIVGVVGPVKESAREALDAVRLKKSRGQRGDLHPAMAGACHRSGQIGV